MTSGASNGYVLTSDGSGNATWSPSNLPSLSQVLAVGNTSSGDIIMTEGDDIVFKYSGFNNNINTQPLTSNRVILFPNASGTVSLTSDLDNYLPLTGGTLTGDLTINGNLSILGTQTVINTENLYVEDNIITLNATYSGPAIDAGIEVNLGDGTYSKIIWDAGTLYWQAGLSGSESTIITENGSGLLKSNNTLSVDFATVSSVSYVNSAVGSASNFSNTNLTFSGNRDHNTDGYYYSLTTDNGSYLESWHYLDSTINQIGYDTNQLFFNGTSSIYIYFANVKRLNFTENETVFNEDSYNNLDFRIEGDTDQNLFFVDASTDRIGIGTSSVDYKLHVVGTVSTTGFRMTNGASSGYVLTSDASGNATWNSPSVGVTKYSGTSSFTAGVTQSISHSLNTEDVIVQTYDSSGIQIIPGSIQVTGTSSVDIMISSSLSSVKIVIIG
jgi:hypothetical protein